ncbi:MAG: zeta toxin family protein [Proteobacteria bacterium]|nr:zeta toxin family protein [Pseudomonadota bacterium]
MPHLVVIAGPNGAGKSTSAPALLRNTLHLNNFVNADVIAQGLCAYQPETVAIQAGRIMLKRMNDLANEGVDFSFETTLSSRHFASWFKKLSLNGYKIHLVYLCLDSAQLAVQRVRERVASGGHFVPERIILRRYSASLRNFFHLYTQAVDSWQLYDNSVAQEITLVASKRQGSTPLISNQNIWDHLQEKIK